VNLSENGEYNIRKSSDSACALVGFHHANNT